MVNKTRAGDFADGLREFNTRGSLVVPVRLTTRAKEIILILIEEDKQETSVRFDEDDSPGSSYSIFMQAMQWLENKITGKKLFSVRFDGAIAYEIFCWTLKRDTHHLSSEPDFEIAMQWCTNQWNSKYAQAKLVAARESVTARLRRKSTKTKST